MLDIKSDISDRKVLVYGEEIILSNYDIKHLREISASSTFNDKKMVSAVEKVIKNQIVPFLESAKIPASEENIVEELKEGFHTHVYLFLHDHSKNG